MERLLTVEDFFTINALSTGNIIRCGNAFYKDNYIITMAGNKFKMLIVYWKKVHHLIMVTEGRLGDGQVDGQPTY